MSSAKISSVAIMRLLSITLFFPLLLVAQDLPYVNWENHPVHALDISPDRNRLAITHTADNRVQLFDIALGYPVRLGHVKVGIDPVSVRFQDNNTLWVINHISDSITVIDFENKAVIDTLQTKDEPYDVIFANNKAFVSCSQANQVMVFDTNNLNDTATIIDVMAEDPRAMVVNSDGTKVYIASFESGNKTTILAGGIDEDGGTLGFPGNPVNRTPSPYQGQNPPPNDGDGFLPPINPILPTPPKVSLIVKQNESGRWLDDNGEDWTHMISGEQANLSGRVEGWTLLDHDVTVINTETNEVSYISGLMNIGMALGFNTAKEQITLVGTDAINHIRYEPILNGIFVRANIGIVDENNTNNPVVKDLNPHLDYVSSSVDQSIRDQSIGDPRGIVWSEDGNTGYVTGMGSNNVIVISSNGSRKNRIEVGEGATGVGLDESHNRLYVWNHFESSLSTVDTISLTEISRMQVFNPIPTVIKEGRKFLYSTHDTSGLGQAACASCHVDARMDKLSWDLGDPSGEVKGFDQNCQTDTPIVSGFGCDDFHPMKGPMMTQTFQDIIGHEPFHWRGDRNGIEEFNGAFMSINGDDTQLSAVEMAQYKNMLATITFPPNPFRNLDNTLPESIDLSNHYTSGRFSPAGESLGSGNPQNGLQLFNLGLLDNIFQCGSCHTVPTGMAVNGSLMLGVINAPIGGQIMTMGPFEADHLGIVSVDGSTQKSIKTPQLRNLHEKVGFEMSRTESLSGFGFLHDGAIDSVARFLSAPAFSVDNDQEVADLVALMMAFSGSELENGSIPLGNTPDESLDTHAGVGKQYTLTQATQFDSSVDELIGIASSGKVDLIVSSNNGEDFIFDASTDKFISQAGEEFSNGGLMSLVGTDNFLNYSLVPVGLGQRLAFDRDGDGVYDYKEIINGSDPTDVTSIIVTPKAGLWNNPDRSGHGMDVELAGNNMFITWYTYNDDSNPTWYLATAEYSANWQADLYSFSWDFNTRTTSRTLVGRVNLEFSSATTAHFSWELNGKEGSEDFTYFNSSNYATTKQFTGSYFDRDDGGWGVSIITKGSVLIVVEYYYDETGQPRWVLASGENKLSSTLEMKSYKGFCPECSHVATTNEVIGTADIEFISEAAIKFSSQITYPDNTNDTWSISDAVLSPLSSSFFDPEVQ